MKKALVVFALREEFAPWKRRHAFRRSLPGAFSARIGEVEVYVALAGAGCPTIQTIREITDEVQPDAAIITGVAAGLRPEWRTGQVFAAKSVAGRDHSRVVTSDALLLALAKESGANAAGTLVTLDRIVRTVEEKRRLGESADAADMESLPLMEFWAARAIPALAARVILDPVDAPMTVDFEAAMDREGQIRTWKVAVQALRHPRLLPELVQLARQNRRALRCLAEFLDGFIGAWGCSVGETI
jgi:nucleoside phosphorylase